MESDSRLQSAQILAGTTDLVPTGSYRGTEDEPVDWPTAIKRAIRSESELRNVLRLPGRESCCGEQAFPTFVPWEFLRRIVPGDPADPLLLQVLPVREESRDHEGFSPDPVGDLAALVTPGLLHKYEARALVVATGACGVHCRYCFRREFPYADFGSPRELWQPAIDYLQEHNEIEEVLLSGGDPLTLVDHKLDELITKIESVSHVRRLRVHTRMPIVIPQRVTSELVNRLAASRLTTWVVVHANHPHEIDDSVTRHISMLIDAGIPILNQSVLLRGVNDSAETLIELSKRLIDHRIHPYYLHQLDRVHGTAHFEVPIETGLKLVEQMRRSLPGYAVPQYVTEQSGAASKSAIVGRVIQRDSDPGQHVRL